jgi:hypothetical protein
MLNENVKVVNNTCAIVGKHVKYIKTERLLRQKTETGAL